MYLQNKYTNWYFSIISNAQSRTISGYTEKHHIIPKSLGGSDKKDNLVRLTAREHFICHWLLTKMTIGENQKKMAYACKRMMTANSKQKRYKITGHIYELLKTQMNSMLKDRVFTNEWKNKLKTSAQQRAKNIPEQERQMRAELITARNKARKGEKRPWMQGDKNYFHHNKFCGEQNHFFNKTHSEETLKKLRVPKPKMCCIHCQKEIAGQSNLSRWHGDHCKHR